MVAGLLALVAQQSGRVRYFGVWTDAVVRSVDECGELQYWVIRVVMVVLVCCAGMVLR